MKKCTKCGETKPLEEFHKDARDGRKLKCKACDKLASAAYYVANKDRIAAIGKAWRDSHRAQKSRKDKAWRTANLAKVNVFTACYKAAKINATPRWANLSE